MPNTKTLLRIVVLLVAVLALAMSATGCFGTGKIELDQESYIHEYGEIFMVPFATCTNGMEVSVQIFDADGYEIPVEYGTATLEIGEYKMVFTAGRATKEVPLTCMDTVKPEVNISIDSLVVVGHWFTLPTITANDVSGIDTSKTKVELYKAGESTPVLAVPGERVRIESVSSYTLKATVVDKAGNVAVTEKWIKVIDRPDSEVLQDFSTELEPFHEISYGAGQPVTVWYDEYEGKQGVIGLGCGGYENVPGGDYAYLWWTGLGMDNLNLVGATGFTFKMKVASNVRQLAIKSATNGSGVSLTNGIVRNEWTEVTVSLVNSNPFYSLSYATVGISLASGYKSEGVCVWIDEVIVHYAPYTEYNVTVEDGYIDYAFDTVPEGRKVTVKHNKAETPEGKAFSHYLINGERLWGDSFVVTCDTTVTAVYVDLNTVEKPIPDGAVMVEDFSGRGLVEVLTNKGQYQLGLSAWYATYDGVAGVRSIGFLPNEGWNYLWWKGILPTYFDYESYTHLTFRIKVTKSGLRSLGIGGNNVLGGIMSDDEWVDVKIPISALNDNIFSLANTYSAFGEMVLIDQIYATVEEDTSSVPELEIPEGSTMITDFSGTVKPTVSQSWGDGPSKAYYTTSALHDGRTGVFTMGATGEAHLEFMDFGLSSIDLTGAGSITFRIKVSSALSKLELRINDAYGINLLSVIDVSDAWTEVSVNISSLGLEDITNVKFTFRVGTPDKGEYVWLDQVYTSLPDPNAPQEHPIPEGAVMVSDYSTYGTYFNNPNFGTGAVGVTNLYAEYNGAVGVRSFGLQANQDVHYTKYAFLPGNFDYSGYTHITFRLYVKSGAFRGIWLSGTPEWGTNLLPLITEFDTWTTVTIPISDLSGGALILSNTWGKSGDALFIDQVYVTVQDSNVQ